MKLAASLRSVDSPVGWIRGGPGGGGVGVGGALLTTWPGFWCEGAAGGEGT